MFLRYDKAAAAEEKSSILMSMLRQNNIANVTLDHAKPEYLNRMDDSQSSQSEDESMKSLA